MLCFLLLFLSGHAQAQHELQSPDGKIKIAVAQGEALTYAVYLNNDPLVLPSAIDLQLQGKRSGFSSRISKVTRQSVQATILSPVPEKRKAIPDHFNEMTLHFGSALRVQFRAYDDGVAYRFVTGFKDSLVVTNEKTTARFPKGATVYYPEVKKRADADLFHTSFEEPYKISTIDSMLRDSIAFTPVLVSLPAAKLVLTESDLEDYPGMFVRGNGTDALEGVFAPYPAAEKIVGTEFQQKIVTERAPYIARTAGSRSFPWRVLAIATDDRQLPNNDIIYRLASPSRIANTDWIKPGKGTDEWIIGINLFNVPFKAGLNTTTYKYYIDFAKRFGFDRIMMDAGWSDNNDLLKINPAINMDTIAAYAQKNGIGLSMWTLALTLDRQLDSALKQFQKWGVSFIMTDFIDRDDQKAVAFHHRIARACADHKIMLMFHGSFKPAGFNRTWPNAVTREAVLGSEYNAWSHKPHPDHNLLQPFIRMVAGPMDYEPGLLDNGTKETFRPIWNKVMSMGTKIHQMAMFVVYESPVQLFSGNPSQGLLEPQLMELVGSIPTTWDETIIPQAKLGEYIITARKKGDDWFIGGMSNWNARTLELSFDFLPEGTYAATIAADGINADRYASDYTISQKEIKKGDTLIINMAPGGGWVMRLKRL